MKIDVKPNFCELKIKFMVREIYTFLYFFLTHIKIWCNNIQMNEKNDRKLKHVGFRAFRENVEKRDPKNQSIQMTM